MKTPGHSRGCWKAAGAFTVLCVAQAQADVPTIQIDGGLHGPRVIEASGFVASGGDPLPVFGVHGLFQPGGPPGEVRVGAADDPDARVFASRWSRASFGYSVEVFRDGTNDGVEDLLVGEPVGRTERGEGAVFVIDSVTGETRYVLLGPEGESFGWRIEYGQDYDGNGIPDVRIASRFTDDAGAIRQRWNHYSGSTLRPIEADAEPEVVIRAEDLNINGGVDADDVGDAADQVAGADPQAMPLGDLNNSGQTDAGDLVAVAGAVGAGTILPPDAEDFAHIVAGDFEGPPLIIPMGGGPPVEPGGPGSNPDEPQGMPGPGAGGDDAGSGDGGGGGGCSTSLSCPDIVRWVPDLGCMRFTYSTSGGAVTGRWNGETLDDADGDGLVERVVCAAECVTLVKTRTCDNGSDSAECTFKIYGIDIDLAPEPADQPWEDSDGTDARPGHVLEANYRDLDGDGLPEYLDGYDLWGDATALEDVGGGGLHPLVIQPLIPPCALAEEDYDFTIRVAYDLSDPRQVGNAADVVALPDQGRSRIWTKPGDVPRNAAPVSDGGDLLLPGTYLWSDLREHLEWHADDDASGPGYLVAYFEVVRPSDSVGDTRVTAELVADTIHDSIGSTDELSVTAWRREFWTRGLGEPWRPGWAIVVSRAPSADDPWPQPGDFTPGPWLEMQWRYYDPRNLMGTNVTVPAGPAGQAQAPIAENYGPWWHTLPLQIFDSTESFEQRPDLPLGVFITPQTPLSRTPSTSNILSTGWDREIYKVVRLVVAQLEGNGFPNLDGIPVNRTDPGVLGRFVHEGATIILSQRPRWAMDVWIEQSTGLITRVGSDKLPTFQIEGTVQIDALYLNEGETLAPGQVLHPNSNKVVAAYDIKQSTTGGIPTDQQDRIQRVIGDQRPLKSVTSERHWTLNRNWYTNRTISRRIKWKGVFGIGIMVSAYVYFNDEFDYFRALVEPLIIAAARSTPGSLDQQLHVSEILAVTSQYIATFLPDTDILDGLTTIELYRRMSDWTGLD